MARKSASLQTIELLKIRVNNIHKNFDLTYDVLAREWRGLLDKTQYLALHPLSDINRGNEDIMYRLVNKSAKSILKTSYGTSDLRRYIKKFSIFGSRNIKKTISKMSFSFRDEYLSKFVKLGKDNSLIKMLKRKGLYEDSDFWKSFFNSEYFVPLYKEYPKGGETEVDEKYELGDEAVLFNGTLWGHYIREYIKVYKKGV